VQTRTLLRAAHAALRARQRQYDMRDVLERERATRVHVEAASRAKDEFLATVSHELRTPLNAILGWARMLRTGDLPIDRRDRALATIERNARAQAELIEDLLDGSRIVAGTLALVEAPVDLGEIIATTLDVFRPAAEAKGIAITTRIAPRASTSGDARRLAQIVSNLLGNAVKFTPSGGRIEVTLQSGNPHHEIVVSDTGVGIAPAFLPHVFERFRQSDGSTTRLHGGLGLGLAIVRSLVELHRGTVSASSAGIDQGATFTVTLPAISGNIATSAATSRVASTPGTVTTPIPIPRSSNVVFRSSEPASGRLAGTRVLVVDDDADTRDLVVTILRAQGADATAVDSARAALASFAKERPDVLLSDVGMPNEDGYMLIRQVRALASGDAKPTPAIALTAYARTSDRERALDAGFDVHVTKPLVPSELIAVVARVLDR
nr:ATP-binding protein [Myxococcota bacterium]